MTNAEWERLKEALGNAPTPEARKEAAEAMRRYQKTRLARGKGSKPTLVSLGYKKTYPHAVPVDKIADEIERSPEFFDLLSRIIVKS